MPEMITVFPFYRWTPVFVVVAGAALFVFLLIRTALRYRGRRLVKCPDNHCDVEVHFDLPHAAMTGVIGPPELRLDQCSRWPEMKDCGQECLSQLAGTPEDCLIREIVTRWYWGKRCVYCSQPVGVFHWPDFRSALLLPDGNTIEWQDVAPNQLRRTLEDAKPVCWKCHVAESFRNDHPELVTDRPGDIVGPCGERNAER